MIIYSDRTTWKVFYLAHCWEANGCSEAELSLQNPLQDTDLKPTLLPSSLIVMSVVTVVLVYLPGVTLTLRKERFPESTAKQRATGLMIQALTLHLKVFTNSCLTESCPCLGCLQWQMRGCKVSSNAKGSHCNGKQSQFQLQCWQIFNYRSRTLIRDRIF